MIDRFSGGDILSSDSEQEEREQGFALVLVLLFLLLVASVVTPFVVATQTDASISRYNRNRQQLVAVADGLLITLAARLTGGWRETIGVPLNGSQMTCSAGDLNVAAAAQVQTGLVDLNAAQPELLEQGFRVAGLDAIDAKRASDAVRDFRSYEPERPGKSVFLAGAKNAPFESVSELSDLVSLTSIDPGKLQSLFTVYSKQGWVDPAFAPDMLRDVLMSAGPMPSAHESEFAALVAIRVAVHRNKQVQGYSGFVLDISGGAIRRLEPLQALDDVLQARPDKPCPAWMAETVRLFGVST